MHFRKTAVSVAVLVSLFCSQTASFAGAASRAGLISGHVRFFGSKKIPIKQPAPVQAASNVNVRDFGATGNGVTDDTPAIQNAIAAAKASGQGVLFPAGTYLHANAIIANGVGLVGVGGASVLLANNPNSCGVVLSGLGPSISNIVVSTVPAGGPFFLSPVLATIAFDGAQNFSVQNVTILQGMNRVGVLLSQSAIGQIGAVSFNGSGTGTSDYGVYMLQCANVTLLSNLFNNETFGIRMGTGNLTESQSLSIAIISNTIFSNSDAMQLFDSTNVDVAQNQIVAGGIGISTGHLNNFSCMNNTIFNASLGIFIESLGTDAAIVSQNIIRNCQSSAASFITAASGSVQFLANQIGECGLAGGIPNSIISVNPQGGPSSVVLLNNVYAGHANNLNLFITSAGHLSFVSGNVQTQTALPNSLP